MKISAINPYMCRYSNYSFKSNNSAPKTMGVADKLPNPRLYADCSDFNIPWEKRDAMIKDYRAKICNVCFGQDKKLDERLVDYLNNTEFEIESSTGGKQKMTIADAIKDSIYDVEPYNQTLYHATNGIEVGEKIIKEGFDPIKISRSKIGPGFYFTPSEGHALEYSRSVLKADCAGNCAYVKPAFYERITGSSNILSSLTQFIGLDTSGYPLGSEAYSVASTVLNEYVRNYFVNDLNVDMAYGQSSRAESCYAVFNPKSISNIRFK